MKIVKFIVLILFIFFSTGCISYVELSDLEVIENITIDYKDNTYTIYVTSIEKEENLVYEVTKGEGKAIEEALNNIKTKENKKLYIAHLKLLLITPSANNEKLKEIISFFLENSESRNDFSVALIEDTSQIEDSDKTKDIAQKIKIIEEDLATTKACYFEDLLKDLLEKNQSYLPIIKNEEDSLQVKGIQILKDNKKIELTEEETILFNYMNNDIHKTSFKENNILSNTTIIQTNDTDIEIQIESVLANKTENYQEDLKEAILEMLKKYQEQEIDVFNLTYIIKKQNPSIKEDEVTLLKSIELNIIVKEKATKKQERKIDFEKTNKDL